MHTSQIKLTRPASDGPADWNTHYTGTFVEKPIIPVSDNSALDKLLGQLGIYATWLSAIAYLQRQLRIFIFLCHVFFSVITRFHIA